MKVGLASIFFCLHFICFASPVAARNDDLRPILNKAKKFVKTQLPGKWRVFRTFTSEKAHIDICWESKKDSEESIEIEIEAFPDVTRANKRFNDLNGFFLPMEVTEESITIDIFDFGDEGKYSYSKRFPNYLDHIIDLNFRKGRLIVEVNAPSDKIARALASFVDRETGEYRTKTENQSRDSRDL